MKKKTAIFALILCLCLALSIAAQAKEMLGTLDYGEGCG